MKFLKINFPKFLITLILISCVLTIRVLAEKSHLKGTLPSAKHYNAAETGSKIKIDGVLDEAAWKEADVIPLPYEWSPGDNIPAPVKTECLITFSKTRLYLGFRCFDPEPGKIRRHLMERDNISGFVQDDFVCVSIDTFNDERRAFEFVVNPLGVQAEGIFNELDGIQDFSWDAIWESAGRVTDFGYVVELAIPFNQIRFANTRDGEKQTWGFSIERSYPRNVNHIMISHIKDRNVKCLLCQANKVSGFKQMSQGRNFEVAPTLTLDRTDHRVNFPAGEMEKGEIHTNPGLTVRWGITPDSTLNAAINPDFSQVEADAAQLEVNTRFALRYPEKRPFFLEGKDFFYSPLEVVFTRTVFEPLWGLKMTGKTGKSAVAIFAAQDRYNNLLFPSNRGSTQFSTKENVYGGVIRYRRDVGKGSTIGLLYTGRVSNQYYNHLAGADGFLRLSKTKDISFQWVRSFSKYPEEIANNWDQPLDSFAGQALYAKFKHSGRHLHYEVEYEDLSPQFRADYGFISRVDTRRISAFLRPIIWGKKGSWFNIIAFVISGGNITDHKGNLTDRHLQFAVNYYGPLKTFIQPKFTSTKEFYNDRIFHLNKLQTDIQIRPIGSLNLSIQAKFGDTIDYFNSRKSDLLLLNPGIDWRIGQHLNINLNHMFERMTLSREHVYTVHLLQTRLVYHFNVKTFLRAIVQFTDINRNLALYTRPIEANSTYVFTQFLFSYIINPQTVLFVGYSGDYSGENNLSLPGKNRTFFLKLGYALQL